MDKDNNVAEENKQEIMVAVRDNPGIVLLDQKRFEEFYERIKAETEKLAPDLTTQKGRDAIASMAFKVAKTKTAIDAAGKILKEEAQATVTKVDAARKLIRDRLDALRDEVRKPLTDYEQDEEARIENCKATIRHIEECGRGFIGGEQQPYVILLREVEEKVVIDETFREFESEATTARAAAIERLKDAMERERQAESDRVELERLRAEAEARAEHDRLKQEAAAAAEAAKREKEEAEKRAAQEKEQAQAIIDAAAKAAEEAARMAAEAKANEERLAQQRAHDEALTAEKRRFDEAEAARKAEADKVAAEKAAADARAADVAHRSKIMGAAKDAIMKFGVDEAVAKSIVLAIKADEIPNVSIRF